MATFYLICLKRDEKYKLEIRGRRKRREISGIRLSRRSLHEAQHLRTINDALQGNRRRF